MKLQPHLILRVLHIIFIFYHRNISGHSSSATWFDYLPPLLELSTLCDVSLKQIAQVKSQSNLRLTYSRTQRNVVANISCMFIFGTFISRFFLTKPSLMLTTYSYPNYVLVLCEWPSINATKHSCKHLIVTNLVF